MNARELAMALYAITLAAFLGYLIGDHGRDKAEWDLVRCEGERDRATGKAAQYLQFYCEERPGSFLCAWEDK